MNALQQKKLKLAIYLCIYSDVKRLFFSSKFIQNRYKNMVEYQQITHKISLQSIF